MLSSQRPRLGMTVGSDSALSSALRQHVATRWSERSEAVEFSERFSGSTSEVPLYDGIRSSGDDERRRQPCAAASARPLCGGVVGEDG